ncbi:PEP-CTERM system TPR-repeat protein PrsT [Aestuariibacter halophilus]|uniref:PEP-CTERM system TPR-repeat protein PrsT n=1 Tax=Fluctibacter halophilus TaxID=226011 RepID=A0ABS8G4I0_9ALTE|nr:XrtA/PEP-CTERM system TPR-repeat protein PrsT [Aestuariibacter halophilus]MCC2614760.1 PEP-CTERM system TPR-repeat protein PrsT [Aestuariibacter halophilus]
MFGRLLPPRSVALLTLSLLLSPLADARSKSSEFYEKALNAFNQNDVEAAYIHLKNSLQADNNYLPAKILMGKILMVSGYLDEAETELQESLAAGADTNLVAETLGKIWLYQKQYDKIINADFKGLDTTNQINWALIVATAYLNQEQVEKARDAYQSILRTAPDDVRALNALAAMALNEQALDTANQYLQRAQTRSPKDPSTLRLLGEYHLAEGNVPAAVEVLERGEQIHPDNPLLRRTLMSAYLQNQDEAKARALLDRIIEQTPDDPTATLMHAWLDARNNSNEEAASQLEALSGKLANLNEETLNDSPNLIYIQALAAFANNRLEKARTFFSQYLNRVPDNLDARRMLAQTLLRLGQARDALEVMERGDDAYAKDLDAGIMLGELYLTNNKAFRTLELLSRMRQHFGQDRRLDLLEIKMLIARERYDQAFQKLDESPYINDDVRFVLTKSMLYLRTGQFDKANEIADKLLELAPDNIDFLNFKSAVLIKVKDWPNAMTFIEKVLAERPQHYAARFNQVTVLAASGQGQQALPLVKTLHEEQPDNLETLLMYAGLLLDNQQRNLAQEKINRALKIDRDNLRANQLQVNILLGDGEKDKAIRVLNSMVKTAPDNLDIQLQRAGLLLDTGNQERAEREFARIAEQASDNPGALVALSDLEYRARLFDNAKAHLEQAIKLAPDHVAVGIAYVRMQIALDEDQRATRHLRHLSKNHAEQPELIVLDGDLLLRNNQPDKAFERYWQAYQQAPSYRLALIKLYQLAKQGVAQDAFASHIESMVEANPENHFQRNLLADHYVHAKQPDKAKRHYLALVEADNIPNKAVILNNLANLSLDSDLEAAAEFIRQAMAINSDLSSVVDTHGWILARQGQYDEALTTLRRAFAMDSNEPSIRYHLGYTLHKLGRNSEAQEELAAAIASESSFSERDAAQQLLEQL